MTVSYRSSQWDFEESIDYEIDLAPEQSILKIYLQHCVPLHLFLIASEMSFDISSILKQFTFPFAIEETGVPFSTVRNTNDTIIYNGGAETGAQFRITCKSDVSNLIIYDANNVSRQFKIDTTLLKNSVVIIDTEANPKTCKEYRVDGTVVNILKFVKNPTWFILKKGLNKFGFSADSELTDIEVAIAFTNKYLGV